mgnify:CR=1 FL=1
MRDLLKDWVLQAVEAAGGEASPTDVAKHIWLHHERDLRDSGDLFYTWQYDMRWAAQKLRDQKFLVISPSRKWAKKR